MFCAVTLQLTMVAGGKSGVVDMEGRVRGTKRGAQKRREMMNRACRERGISGEAQSIQREMRVKAS